ncbi:MAG TPA: M20/M25/M40 family metallo-hydrolase [Gemmatimonadaceae bacterium]|jgi:Zn-dependent M28 family amino/carboxypeptidase
MRIILAAAITLLGMGQVGSRVYAQDSTGSAARMVQRAVVERELSALADDSMQGRMTGTPGAARSARYIAEEMAAIGLIPAGDSGYFQRVPVGRLEGSGQLILEEHLAPGAAGALDRVPAVNVVGIIRGGDPVLGDSAVLVDAHYDHLGIGRPVHGDSIYNGADDDGSGTVAVLEIARAMRAGPTPRRTVIFLTTIGEEVGLLGTRWFVSHPVVPLDRIEANLEIEMIGRPDSLAGGPGRGWLTGFDRSTMGEMFARAGLPIVPDRRPSQNFFMRSDNIAFARRGIPAHTLSSFALHTDYHEPSDELSRIDFAHMTELIDAAARAVRLLADGPAPHWNPGGRP